MLDLNHPRTKFWLSSRSIWPDDSPAFIFLGRAIDAIGKSMFRDRWMGWQDVVVQYAPTFPKQQPFIPNEITRQAYSLLEKYRPELGLKRVDSDTPPRSITRLTSEHWMLACELHSQMSSAVNLEGFRRFAQVRKAVIREAAAGNLETIMRRVPGGAFSPIPQSWWNSERLDVRFEWCQVNPNEPFGYAFASESFSWIFLSRETLSKCFPTSGPQIAEDKVPIKDDAPSEPDLATYYDLISFPGKKQQAVFSAIKTVWPDGKIPRLLSIAEIENQISPVVKRMGDPGGASADNIRRALGLKK